MRKFALMEEAIINKVSESSLITLNLEDFFPKGEDAVFDIKDHLFMGLILKEKDFREAMKNLDLQSYAGKNVAVTCSADAIVPVWAYMLVASFLQPVVKELVFGTSAQMQQQLLIRNISQLDFMSYTDKRIVIKGCGDLPIGEAAYLEIAKVLRPVAKSIMYGEPCSTVPIYKRK